MGRKPRFFCDHCSAEVGRNAGACPRCGRFFSSVRCPSCGLVGGDDTFAGGCPSCGYSAPPPAGAARPPAGREKPRPIPFWAFFLSVGVAVLAFAALLLLLL